MRRLRFLLDEHMPRPIQGQLLRLSDDIDVLLIGQPNAPIKGTPDPDLLRWIERTGYILVTANRRTIPTYLRAHLAAGGHVPGVMFIRRRASVRQVVDDLFLIWVTSDAEEFQDRVLFIPL